ncbi:tetratricopeptide repeat protein [Massilia sp. CF038]|uniref:tetratricopeptide repeat protein n=1 Tax=Massilia sp. CF038 TaxID=1881045 RepID=UPI0009199EA3|nr:tetratricopeptide repeat protein [Massilia sp. CF038]SHH50924.1 Tetratricopeptide repeat-containing protein [Massilia sp. CF038]
MKTGIRLLITCCCLVLAGCATQTQLAPMPSSADLYQDAKFAAPSRPVNADQLFDLSPAMQNYLRSPGFQNHTRNAGQQRGLFDALYTSGELKLDYDSTYTRNAAETFAARKGNCLSLVIMTAAFARAMGLNPYFQQALIDQQWSREGSLYIASTHVNLRLANRPIRDGTVDLAERSMTVDFLPPEDSKWYPTLPLDEATIVAMYMNNRAAEELARNRLDDAYWWARAAIEQSPSFISAYNTLGVVYFSHGDIAAAEKVYQRALQRSPEDTTLMRNLLPVLARLGKGNEAAALTTRLASIEPTPPFHFFQLGMKAMEQGRYAEARAQFAREVQRSPYYHEFHFWLAMAHWQLGEAGSARKQMSLAVDTSTTAEGAKRYSSKLDYLRSLSAAGARKAW